MIQTFPGFNLKQPRLLVIDPTVMDYHQLLAGLHPDYSVLVLDRHRDGVDQITDRLVRDAEAGIYRESLHIVSHGAPGTLYLGNGELSLTMLAAYTPQLQRWGSLVNDLVLYGCQVAAGDAGAEFIERLHGLTGLSIAASATKTGSAQL
ncbi:MAG: DUF4347 domain-containing protein, partial [Leptolyngbyaceae cyanobacterium]